MILLRGLLAFQIGPVEGSATIPISMGVRPMIGFEWTKSLSPAGCKLQELPRNTLADAACSSAVFEHTRIVGITISVEFPRLIDPRTGS
jgi:hypothetical protein